MPTLRLFIAVDTPAGVKSHMAALRDELARRARGVRWEAAEKFHCTLRFLGSVDSTGVASIEAALRSAASLVPPLQLGYSGIGAFPDAAHPRVIWVGVRDASGGLERLRTLVCGGLEELGFPPAEHSFQPHVTLGRAGGKSKLIDIVETRTFEHLPVIVPAVELMQSMPGPRGSVYSVLASIPLTGT